MCNFRHMQVLNRYEILFYPLCGTQIDSTIKHLFFHLNLTVPLSPVDKLSHLS